MYKDSSNDSHKIGIMTTLMNLIKTIKISPKTKPQQNEDSLTYRIQSKLDQMELNVNITQSLRIRIGIWLEKMINIYAQNNKNLNIIQSKKNSKGQYQQDFYAIDEKHKQIFYFEFKSNINLDTEKARSTKTKIKRLLSKHQQENYEVKGGLLALRYLYRKNIPSRLQDKFKGIDLYGINEFFQLIGVDTMTDEEYDNCLIELVQRLEK